MREPDYSTLNTRLRHEGSMQHKPQKDWWMNHQMQCFSSWPTERCVMILKYKCKVKKHWVQTVLWCAQVIQDGIKFVHYPLFQFTTYTGSYNKMKSKWSTLDVWFMLYLCMGNVVLMCKIVASHLDQSNLWKFCACKCICSKESN